MYLHPLVANLPIEEREALVRLCEYRAVRRNEVVLREGKVTAAVFCVTSGLLRTVVKGVNSEAEITTDFIKRGEFFLAGALLDMPCKAKASLVAALPTTVCLIPAYALAKIGARFPSVAMGLLAFALKKAEALRAMRGQVSLDSVESLVCRTLHELTDVAPAGERRYDKRISQAVIASYVGVSRESVNKVMRDFEHRGLAKEADGIYVPPDLGRRRASGQRGGGRSPAR